MANINIPNLGPAGSQGTQNTAPAPAPTPSPMKKMGEKAKNGAPYFIIPIILVFGAYKLAEVLTKSTSLSWFLSSLLVFLVASLIIWAIDGATGSESTPARIPVKAFLIIAFIMSMVRGCDKNPRGPEVNKEVVTEAPAPVTPSFSETLDLSVATFAATKKIFGPGDKPQILVEGNPVRLNQNILAPGEYYIPVTGSGPLVFDKLDGKPATVYLY